MNRAFFFYTQSLTLQVVVSSQTFDLARAIVQQSSSKLAVQRRRLLLAVTVVPLVGFLPRVAWVPPSTTLGTSTLQTQLQSPFNSFHSIPLFPRFPPPHAPSATGC